MFDIGYTELLLIAVVALLVIGPKELPNALRSLGRMTGKARAMTRHLRSGFDEMMRQAELEEMEAQWKEHNRKIMDSAPAASDFVMDPMASPAYGAAGAADSADAAQAAGADAEAAERPAAERPAAERPAAAKAEEPAAATAEKPAAAKAGRPAAAKAGRPAAAKVGKPAAAKAERVAAVPVEPRS